MTDHLLKVLFVDIVIICCIPQAALHELFLSNEFMRVHVRFELLLLCGPFIIISIIFLNEGIIRIDAFSGAYESHTRKLVIVGVFKGLGRARRREILVVVRKGQEVGVSEETRRGLGLRSISKSMQLEKLWWARVDRDFQFLLIFGTASCYWVLI